MKDVGGGCKRGFLFARNLGWPPSNSYEVHEKPHNWGRVNFDLTSAQAPPHFLHPTHLDEISFFTRGEVRCTSQNQEPTPLHPIALCVAKRVFNRLPSVLNGCF